MTVFWSATKAAVGTRRGLRVPTASRSQRGAVTAETAAVLPVLFAVVIGLVWLVALAATQVRVVDAARETARAAARDETRTQAVEIGSRVAPRSARITVEDSGSSVEAKVVAEVSGPGGLFRFLPPVTVESYAVAAKESQ